MALRQRGAHEEESIHGRADGGRSAGGRRHLGRSDGEEAQGQRADDLRLAQAIVGLLALAADGHEAQLAVELEQLLELGQLPDLEALTALLAPRRQALPEVEVELPALASYDALLGAAR